MQNCNSKIGPWKREHVGGARWKSILQFIIRTRPLLLVLAFILGASVVRAEDFPLELTRFAVSDKNPVFTAAGSGHWDAKIRERGWILKEGDIWRLWYTGFDGTPSATMKLGLATSRDGLTWTRHAGNPLYAEHWVEDMMVVKQGDQYFMFAEGLKDRAQLLTSSDGMKWTRIGPLEIHMTNGRPISEGPYGTPTAWFEDGAWYLFYERGDTGVWLAKSADLKVWTNVQDDPVLSLGPGSYDKVMIALNQIIKHDGRYYALFHGTGTLEKPRLWTTNIAVSQDLVHWKKFDRNPLLPEKENKSSGILVHDGEQFRLYTMHDRVDVHFPVKK